MLDSWKAIAHGSAFFVLNLAKYKQSTTILCVVEASISSQLEPKFQHCKQVARPGSKLN